MKTIGNKHCFGLVSDLCLNDGCEAEAGDDTPCPSPRQWHWWPVWLTVIICLVLLFSIPPPKAQLGQPPVDSDAHDTLSNRVPVCKICHCGKTVCHRDCGEENMCMLKCEGLCQRKK